MIYISSSYHFSSAILCCAKLIVIQYGRHKVIVIVEDWLIKDFWAFHFNQTMKRFSYLDRCISYRSFLALSLFAFPCVIILSTHYEKLSSNATVFSPKEYIKIDIRCSESLQGSWVLYPRLWILKSLVPGSGILDPGSWVLVSWVSDLGSWGPRTQGPGILDPGVPGPGSSF